MEVDPSLDSSESSIPISSSKLTNEKKRMRSISPLPSTSGVPTSNYFQVLDNNSNQNSNQNSNPIDSRVKKFKPPPIIITGGVNFCNIRFEELLKSINISEYLIKNISIGVKVFLNNHSNYDDFMKKLKHEKLDFFSFGTKEDKKFKCVLSGLPVMETDEIVKELKSVYNLNVISINLMKSKFNNINNAQYFVSFSSKEVSMHSLKEIKAINFVIVKWKKYVPKNRGPTQCLNCCMFGHGQSFCNRQSVCIICANFHKSSICPFKSNVNVNSISFRCINCVRKKLPFNHKADDISCPCRAEFISIQSNSNKKVKKINLNDSRSFPNLSNRNSAPIRREVPAPVQNLRSLISYSDQVKSNSIPNESTSDNLFSRDELFEIFMVFEDRLRKATSKMDQIRIIGDLLRYGY